MSMLGIVHSTWGLAVVSGKTVAMALGWVLGSSILGPILEEVLNRGYWFQNIQRGWGVAAATLVTCVLFGGLHLLNPNAEILGAVNISLSALTFVLGMVWLRSLWFPIGWHAAWNFFEFFLAGLPNSGISVSSMGLQGTTLLISNVSGPVWLSGGEFGMEASLINTIVLVCAIAVMFWVKQRQSAPTKNRD